MGVVAVVTTLLVIPDLRPGVRHRLDLGGVALASAGLLLAVLALIEGQRYDWSAGISGTLAAGVAALGLFLLWETRQSEPLLPIGLFRLRGFSLMNGTGAAMQFGMQGVFIPISIYTQTVLGMSALVAGLTVAPMSLVAGVVAPFAGSPVRPRTRTGS